MDVGIFAKIFARPTLEDTLDAVKAHGLQYLQFNMACAGVMPLPDAIPDDQADRIRLAMQARGLTLCAMSGTFNMIAPDKTMRQAGLQRLRTLAQACTHMGTSVVTLCTGTRDPENMWRRHPDNDSPEAWADLLAAMQGVLRIADDTGVTFGIEPEMSNVINSAPKARRLLDELASPHIKIIMDGSNLLHASQIERMPAIFREAFELLGRDIVLVHAKDLILHGQAEHGAAGTGALDYDLYLDLLSAAGFDGPLILHTLAEDQVDASVAFLRGKLARRP